MHRYPGDLVRHEKDFYVTRYIKLLRKKGYPGADAFEEYGSGLWDRVKELPTGFSHGDMYSGNILRSRDGALYLLDFDTSCKGLPLYDLALISNQTDYFKFRKDGCPKTEKVYERLLSEYLKVNPLTEKEIGSLYDMIALYHFALQATIIEFVGLHRFDDSFFDRQLIWLLKWKEQCRTLGG
jgi:Ser/Thr protein kinase RdoA (MazF antagonist)